MKFQKCNVFRCDPEEVEPMLWIIWYNSEKNSLDFFHSGTWANSCSLIFCVYAPRKGLIASISTVERYFNMTDMKDRTGLWKACIWGSGNNTSSLLLLPVPFARTSLVVCSLDPNRLYLNLSVLYSFTPCMASPASIHNPFINSIIPGHQGQRTLCLH